MTKRSWVSLIILLILLISIPFGMYLVKRIQIFKPRASYTSVGTTPGGICGDPQNYSISSVACVNGSPDLLVRWSIPQIQGPDSCNVFIGFIGQDNVGKNYSISKQCSGSQVITTLTDLDGVNPQVPIREGVNYTLNVSNGDTNGCYNIPITNTNARQCTTPSPSPSPISFFRPVTGWSEADLRRYRALGFYPVQEPNGDIDLLTRQQFVEYICNNNDACVPKESPTLYSTKNSGVFLSNLLSKLWDHGYAPIPALRPYFMADLDELISLNAHPSVLDAIKNDYYNIIGVPLTDSSQWQRKTIISPDELKQIIIETARSDEYRSDVLYKYANELRADEEYPILNSLLDAYDPIFSVRAAVTLFALAIDQQSPGTRIKGAFGMINVLFPGVGKGGGELVLSAFQKLKVTSQALKMGEVLNLINSVFTKQVGNLQVVPATLIERTLAAADRVNIPIVNGVSYLSSRVFSTTTTLGRATDWGDDANRILGVARDAFGQIAERTPVSPNPISNAEIYYVLGSAQEQRLGIIDFLHAGMGFMINNAYVMRPIVENTLAVSDWVARRLRKPQLRSSIKDELIAKSDKNLSFAMNDEWFDYMGRPTFEGGFANDDFLVLRRSIIQTADGMRQLAHEMTHRLAFVTASVLGRSRATGFLYQDVGFIHSKIANNVPLSKDDIFSILWELGTDLHSVAANAFRSNPDLSAEVLIAELRNTGYSRAFQQFYTAVLNQYKGTEKDDILVYLLEFAETSDARQLIQRLGSVREFQNFVAGSGSIYVSQGDAVVLMEFMKTQGIDLKRLVPIVAPVGAAAGLFGGIYYTSVNSSRPVGPQLNYANAITYGSPSPSPQRTITNIYLELPSGGSHDIVGYTSNPYSFSLRKPQLCNNPGYENVTIRVKYSDNNTEVPFIIKFRSVSSSSLCSSSIGEGTRDWLVPPSENSMKAELTVAGGSSVRLSWERHSRDSKYALRIDASPGYDANCQSPDICMDVSLPEYTFNIREGQPYRWWVHSVYEQPNLNPPQRSASPASVNKEFKFGKLELLDPTRSCSKYYYWTFPVRKKDDKLCFYHRTDCIDYSKYNLDQSCDFDHYVTKEDYSVKADYQSFFTPAETQLPNPPQFTKAECNNGVLDIQWKDGGSQYELRAAKDLSKDEVERIWGKEGSDRPNFAEGNDIKVSDLNQTSYSKDVGANNQFYTVWVHSKNQYGTGDPVYYPEQIRCSAPTVSSVNIGNLSLDLSGNSLPITLSGSQTIPVEINFSSGPKLNTAIRFIYSPPQSDKVASLQASCTNGTLTATWPKVDGAINYELRGGKGLTDRPDDNTWENFPEQDKIIGRQLTNCSSNTCTFTTTSIQPNASYFLWIHSRTNSGISDATKLSSPITCTSSQSNPPPVQPPTSNFPPFTKAECTNGVINISWTGSGSSYELRGGMNLTKEQVLDGTWEASHPTSNDLVGRNLTQTSFSKSVGSNNQFYTIWIHSRNSNGVLSDRVFYPERVYCR